jgi:hypothetical protein
MQRIRPQARIVAMGRPKRIVNGEPNVVDEAFDETLLTIGGRPRALDAVVLAADAADIRPFLSCQDNAVSSTSQLCLDDELEHRLSPPIGALKSFHVQGG